MKKRVLALVMSTAMVASVLTACGGGSGDSDNSGSNQSSGADSATTNAGNASSSAGASGEVQDVTLKVWCPQNQVETGIMEQQQTAFAAEHPEWNITWQTEIVGEDKCKDEVLKDVGVAGDVFMFSTDQLPDLVEAGAIAQLGGATETMVKEENAQAVIDTVTWDDKTYAVPFTHNTFFMYYDKTILDESDVTSLEKIMAKETADNVYNFYFESAGGWKLGCYYYGAGLNIFGEDGSDLEAGVDWNNDTGIAVTNYLIDLINNPKCAFDGEVQPSELAPEHRLGAWFDGLWNYDLYADALGDDLGMAILPTFNPDGSDYQLLSFYSSKAIGVNAQSKNPAAAVAFAAYLGNEENQLLRFEKSAQVPTNLNAGSSETVKADPKSAILVEESNKASVMQPVSSTFSARYWSNAGAIATEIRSGEITKDNVKEKMDTFAAAMVQ